MYDVPNTVEELKLFTGIYFMPDVFEIITSQRRNGC